jgi:hypothetical protein
VCDRFRSKMRSNCKQATEDQQRISPRRKAWLECALRNTFWMGASSFPVIQATWEGEIRRIVI